MVNYLTRHNLIILLAGASVPAFYCIQVTKRSCCSITDFEPQLFCNSPFSVFRNQQLPVHVISSILQHCNVHMLYQILQSLSASDSFKYRNAVNRSGRLNGLSAFILPVITDILPLSCRQIYFSFIFICMQYRRNQIFCTEHVLI